MGRRCVCERLRERVRTEAQLCGLPIAAKWLWVELMMVATRQAGGLIALSRHFSVSAQVSALVSHPEAEVGPALLILIETGLVTHDEASAHLSLPDAVAASARVEAARENGRRGGRPRKDESREDMRARRQGSLLLSVAGGRTETQETERETRQESSRVAAADIDKRESAAATGTSEAWVSLGYELAEIARLDPTRAWSCHDVKGWLDAGVTPAAIRAEVQRIADRPGYEPPGVGLRYFAKPIMKLAEREREERGTPEVRERIAANQRRIDAMLAGTAWGPAPGSAGAVA